MSEGALVLSARGVRRDFRMAREIIQVLRDVDLDLRSGETLAVMGRSGAGKSTLLHLLGLLDRPDGGEIHVGGAPTVGLSREARAQLRNRNVGFVFQFYHLLPELTALENAMLPRMIACGPLRWPGERRAARAEAMALLEELGLGGRARHLPSRLSGGERQRVAVARALVGKPRLLLCDEPTGNLDERTSEVIAGQIFDLSRRHGTALVLVTHDRDLAARADRTLVLHEGRLESLSEAQAAEPARAAAAAERASRIVVVPPARRPPVVTLVGGAVLAGAAVGAWLLTDLFARLRARPDVTGAEVIEFLAIALLGLGMQILIATGLLRGRHWARALFLWIVPLDIALGAFLGIAAGTGPSNVLLVRLGLFAVLAVLLARPASKTYLEGG